MSISASPLTAPQVTPAHLASMHLLPVATAIREHLADSRESSLLIIQKPYRDPAVGDWLVGLLPDLLETDAARFQWTNGESGQPIVFDARPYFRDPATSQDEAARREQFLSDLVAAQRNGKAENRSVAVLVKRAETLPASLLLLPTVTIDLPRTNSAEGLWAACKALFPGFEGPHPLDRQEEAWVRQLVPTDFLACANTQEDAILDALRSQVESRLSALAPTLPHVPLARFAGAQAINAWADDISALIDKRDSEQQNWAWVSPGALLLSSESGRPALLAHALAHHCAIPVIEVDGSTFLAAPRTVVERAQDHSPCLLFISGNDWHRAEADTAVTEQALKAVAAIAAGQVVLVAETVDSRSVHEAWRQLGLFDRAFHVPEVPAAFWGERFVGALPADECDPALVDPKEHTRIGLLVREIGGDAAMSRLIRYLRRKAARQQRKIVLDDFLDAIIRGTIEDITPNADDATHRRSVAYHEAGHALLTMLGSKGETIPDYGTIVPSSGRFEGVIWQFSASNAPSLSYSAFRNQIRVMLAGRAAEEVLSGPAAISSGPSADLASATRLARHAFAVLGFAPDMDTADASGSNLAVALSDEDLAHDQDRLNGLVREFLAHEYASTRALLVEHRPLLDALADRLLNDPIVDREEMRAIYAGWPTNRGN